MRNSAGDDENGDDSTHLSLPLPLFFFFGLVGWQILATVYRCFVLFQHIYMHTSPPSPLATSASQPFFFFFSCQLYHYFSNSSVLVFFSWGEGAFQEIEEQWLPGNSRNTLFRDRASLVTDESAQSDDSAGSSGWDSATEQGPDCKGSANDIREQPPPPLNAVFLGLKTYFGCRV